MSQMPWQVTYDAECAVVETRYSGSLSASDLRSAVSETRALGFANGTAHYLADCSARAGGHSVLDLYGLVDHLETQPTHRFKVAIVLPRLPAAQRDVRFWADACTNRGLSVRVLASREHALSWLCDPGAD